MFGNRADAGKKIGLALHKYKDKNVLVFCIPRGGVEVGYHVAKFLNAELSILVSRKLPYPDNPESGFGAVAEDGSTFIFEDAARYVPKEIVNVIIEEQKKEIKRRVKVLRGGAPLPEIRGRIVVLVDDGIAMGSTMRAAIMMCRKRKAKRIIVAVPVTSGDVVESVGELVDEIVVLEVPENFYAVAQVYANWYDVSDDEVLAIMERWREESSKRRND